MKKHLLAASMVFSALASTGAGYQMNMQGLRQLAMGGSGTAWPWDASTIFYNPGGLSRLNHIQAYGSISWINQDVAYGGLNSSANSSNKALNPFNIYVGGTVKDGSRLGLGIGIYTPYGTRLDWNNDWSGRYMTQSTDLQTIFVQPTVSYKFTERVSLGLGLIYASGRYTSNYALPVQDANSGLDATARLNGTGNGVGFNFGLQMKLSENVQLGATYRSQVNLNLSGGQASFKVPTSLRDSFPNTRFETSMPLPQVASIGIGVKPLRNERLTLQLDLNFTGWNSFDSVRINYTERTSMLQNMRTPRNYRNTLAVRLGGNYKISKVVSVMGGGAYDPSPVVTDFVTPDLPDSDRFSLSCGASVRPFKGFTILAACEFVSSKKRSSNYQFGNFMGTYQTQSVTPGIGITYNF